MKSIVDCKGVIENTSFLFYSIIVVIFRKFIYYKDILKIRRIIMEELYLKNVIGNEKIASKPTAEMIGPLLHIQLPLGKRMTSSWKPPSGYILEKSIIENVPIERIIPDGGGNGKVILILHGGGYVWPLMDSSREAAIMYSEFTDGSEVINVDYRTAPTDVYPAALEDCVVAYKWILQQGYKGEDILLIGESAGGGLVLALSLYLKEHKLPLPKAVVAISPWGDVDDKSPSRRINLDKDLLLGSKGCSIANQVQKHDYAGNWDLKTPYLSPVYGDYTGFPDLLIQVGTFEVLYDDSVRIYEKAKEAGVNVKLSSYYGMSHCFQELFTKLPEGQIAWQEIRTFMRRSFGLSE